MQSSKLKSSTLNLSKLTRTLPLAALLLAGSTAWAAPPQENPLAKQPQNDRALGDSQDRPLQGDQAPLAAPASNSMSAAKANFDAFDKDSSGYIDKQEAMLDPKLTAQFDTLDANRDGKLSVTEFMAASDVAEFRPQQGIKQGEAKRD